MVLTVVTMFVGLFVIILLAKKGVKAAVLVGMLAASVHLLGGRAYLPGHQSLRLSARALPSCRPSHDMVETDPLQVRLRRLLPASAGSPAITLVITFCMIDMFDTIGTLVGTASRAGMADKEGNMPKMKEALLSDAVGTVAGACCRHLHRHHLRGVRLRRGGRRPHRPNRPDRRRHVPGLHVHRTRGRQ